MRSLSATDRRRDVLVHPASPQPDHRTRRLGRRRSPLLVSLLLAALALTACSGGNDAPERSTGSNPVIDKSGEVRNPTFYYQGAHPLNVGADLSALGSPSVVVTTAKDNERKAVDAIHALGAKAYRYVQFYWAPDDEAYEGINLKTHPGWAFCRSGDAPVLGRRTGKGSQAADWHFIDANEKAVRAEILDQLRKLEAVGWDGVMFDRGGAALTSAADAHHRPVWNATSSCTSDPHQKGATFSDAYVATLGLARQAGLKVMLNYGTSPFDSRIPLRPDPKDPRCSVRGRQGCRTLDDAWAGVDLVLNEAIAFPRDQHWAESFRANRLSEKDPDHGRRTVGLLTTFTLGGPRGQNRATVYYEWARVKLFDLALAVNTGDGGCPKGGTRSGVCNRYALYPELTDAQLGEPVDEEPVSRKCVSDVRCVWSRTYEHGVVLVNVRPRPVRGLEVEIPGGTCRHVVDLFSGKRLADDACVRSVEVDLPAWGGRPLLLVDDPA
jgi:hypothetical protein